MFGTVKLIRDQQETIDAYEREMNDLSTKHNRLLGQVVSLMAINNKLQEQLKVQKKEIHKARCEAINYKRAAQKNAAMFNNLMATYANTEGENKDLMATVSGLSGRLDVYERCLGKIEQDEEVEPYND